MLNSLAFNFKYNLWAIKVDFLSYKAVLWKSTCLIFLFLVFYWWTWELVLKSSIFAGIWWRMPSYSMIWHVGVLLLLGKYSQCFQLSKLYSHCFQLSKLCQKFANLLVKPFEICYRLWPDVLTTYWRAAVLFRLLVCIRLC